MNTTQEQSYEYATGALGYKLELCERILADGGRLYDQGVWGTETKCGTAACIAGHQIMMAGGTLVGGHWASGRESYAFDDGEEVDDESEYAAMAWREFVGVGELHYWETECLSPGVAALHVLSDGHVPLRCGEADAWTYFADWAKDENI
jgi:hypothetical protein